ncbi:hypothetical protein LINGRAHAP2_LOCUS30489 [Linum grandiflorum]
MGCNLHGLWVFVRFMSNLIRWLQFSFLPRIQSWDTNIRLLHSVSRSFAVVNRQLIFLIFTVKLILLRTIWLILAIPSLMGCICLNIVKIITSKRY